MARMLSSKVSARAMTVTKATPAKSKNEGRPIAALFPGNPRIAKEQMSDLFFSRRSTTTLSWNWKKEQRGWKLRVAIESLFEAIARSVARRIVRDIVAHERGRQAQRFTER
jgi:hypothetical protein